MMPHFECVNSFQLSTPEAGNRAMLLTGLPKAAEVAPKSNQSSQSRSGHARIGRNGELLSVEFHAGDGKAE
jgi:hypothetical protein